MGGSDSVPSVVYTKRHIVCLCGSTRFKQEFDLANRVETLKGNIVLSCGVWNHTGDPPTESEKIQLDVLHKDKIYLAHEVLVINVNGYIGSSTRSEIDYAKSLGKPIRYIEPVPEEG